jgi:hypothetical protein
MTNESKENDTEETRQEARAEKLRKKQSKIKQHGKGLAKIYRDAVEKREREKGE